jgi:hypothetical protein
MELRVAGASGVNAIWRGLADDLAAVNPELAAAVAEAPRAWGDSDEERRSREYDEIAEEYFAAPTRTRRRLRSRTVTPTSRHLLRMSAERHLDRGGPRPCPRSRAPRRRSVRAGPRKARAPGSSTGDDPEPSDLAVPVGVAL